jgi:hypothetical protein
MREDPRMALHPAENRGYRELYAYSRQLAEHWRALSDSLADPGVTKVLDRGAVAAEELIEELAPLTARQGLHGKPAAQGAGKSIAGGARVRDRFLERNQAARFAIEDLQHVVTLLAYLAQASETSRNGELAEFCGRWERKLKRLESEARKAAAALGADLDGAVAPLDESRVGRVAHQVGYIAGTVGEAFDRRVAKKR